jgi:hypothetical protein
MLLSIGLTLYCILNVSHLLMIINEHIFKLFFLTWDNGHSFEDEKDLETFQTSE